jgi:hypothetical protein
VLGFQTESTTVDVGLAGFTCEASVEEVATVELHPRFRSEYFKHAAGCWFCDFRREGEPVDWLVFVEYKIVIVAATVGELSVFDFNVFADGFWLGEIEWRARNWREFSSRNEP